MQVELVGSKFVDLAQLDVTRFPVGTTIKDSTGTSYRLIESAAAIDHDNYETVANQPALRWAKLTIVGSVVVLVAAGVNGDGPVTLTGAAVGDVVSGATNLSDLANGAASFESVITVVNQIQQSEDADLSGNAYQFILSRGA